MVPTDGDSPAELVADHRAADDDVATIGLELRTNRARKLVGSDGRIPTGLTRSTTRGERRGYRAGVGPDATRAGSAVWTSTRPAGVRRDTRSSPTATI